MKENQVNIKDLDIKTDQAVVKSEVKSEVKREDIATQGSTGPCPENKNDLVTQGTRPCPEKNETKVETKIETKNVSLGLGGGINDKMLSKEIENELDAEIDKTEESKFSKFMSYLIGK